MLHNLKHTPLFLSPYGILSESSSNYLRILEVRLFVYRTMVVNMFSAIKTETSTIPFNDKETIIALYLVCLF